MIHILCLWLLMLLPLSVHAQAPAPDLEGINVKVNFSIRFAPDAEVWGRRDYWATPAEMRSAGAGDCEDYALHKGLLLRRAGMASELLRLGYVQAPSEKHMVLLVLQSVEDKDPLVLDNLVGSIRPLSRRSDLRLIYAFNSNGVWDSTGSPTVEATSLRMTLLEFMGRVQREGEFSLTF